MPPPLSNIQFHYDQPDLGESFVTHRLRATTERGNELGSMLWSAKEIRNIGVSADVQRRGVATGMYQHAQQLAASNPKIPQPKHSADRTKAGDAWARSVGGRLPRRK